MEVKAVGGKTKKRKSKDTPSACSKTYSGAWQPFAQKLALALETLIEDQYLVISRKGTNEFVQFAAEGSWGLRMESTSNHYRLPDAQLNDEQTKALVGMGWQLPTHDQDADDLNPDGSANFYRDCARPLDFSELAAIAVATFTGVMSIAHPSRLEYEAFDRDGEAIAMPDLGLKRHIELDPAKDLPERLLAAIREATGLDGLTFDTDKDIGGITFGSAVTFVRLLTEKPYMRMYSVVANDIDESYALLKIINELNADHGFIHLFHRDGAVMACSDVLVIPLISSSVAHSLANFCQVADEFANVLNAEFGTQGMFVDQQPAQLAH